MPRLTDRTEQEREQLEGQLGCLGNALALIDNAVERIGWVSKQAAAGGLLAPVVTDLRQAQRLIRTAQGVAAGGVGTGDAVAKKFI